MKVLVTIPTLSRADLLIRNKGFLESVQKPDEVLILDNGHQAIDINVPIWRSPQNLGVSGSWNFFLSWAFVKERFDALILLQDDIIWSQVQFEAAKRLLKKHADVGLFLSWHQFSIQIQRPSTFETVGFYDERFTPAYCEDDDYAIRMTKAGVIYQRFTQLNPVAGSLFLGTHKPVAWDVQWAKLKAKWGDNIIGINDIKNPCFTSNRGHLTPPSR